MRVLVTGAQGFIGKLLIKRFRQLSLDVVEFKGDISSQNDLRQFFHTGASWDVIIHLAAIGSQSLCESDPTKAYCVNTIGTALLVDQIRQFSPASRLIFASTGQVYDLNQLNVLQIDEQHPINPMTVYAKSKRLAELCIFDSYQHFEGRYTILRIFNHTHKTQGAGFFLPSIYLQILQKINEGKMDGVIEAGNLNVERDIGAVEDLVTAFVKVTLNDSIKSDVYNICSGIGKSLGSIVAELNRQLKADFNFKVSNERLRAFEPKRIVGNRAKFSHDFDWQPNLAKTTEELIHSFLKDL